MDKELTVIKSPAAINIITFLGDVQGVGHIRVIFPALLLNTYNNGYKIRNEFSSHFVGDINYYKNFSFCVFQRPATSNHYQIIKSFKENITKQTKTPVIFEIDDMLFNIPNWNYASEYYLQNEPFVKEMLKIVDGVVVSTEYLKREYSTYNKNISVNPNRLPQFLWGKCSEWKDWGHDKKRIVYAGSFNHFTTPKLKESGIKGGDFSDKLIDFVKKTADKYHWIFCGGYPDELSGLINNKIEYHRWYNVFEFPHFMNSIEADIVLAPLLNENFNKSKSNLKVLESVAMGCAGVFSNIEPYLGYSMTAETDEMFIDNIETLCYDNDLRKKCWEHNYNLLKDDLYWEENDNLKKYVNNYLHLFGKKLE